MERRDRRGAAVGFVGRPDTDGAAIVACSGTRRDSGSSASGSEWIRGFDVTGEPKGRAGILTGA